MFGFAVAVLAFYIEIEPSKSELRLAKALLGIAGSMGSIFSSITGFGLGWIKDRIQRSFQHSLQDQIIYDLRLPRASDLFAADLWTGNIEWKSDLKTEDQKLPAEKEDFRLLL